MLYRSSRICLRFQTSIWQSGYSSLKTVQIVSFPRPLSVPFLFCATGKETDLVIPLGDSIFHPENANIWPKTAPNRWLHICRGWVLSFQISISCTIEVRGAPFTQGMAQFTHKGLWLICMSSCWLVEVFVRPITEEDTFEQISGFKNMLRCEWSAHIYMLVPQDLCGQIEPLEMCSLRPQ